MIKVTMKTEESTATGNFIIETLARSQSSPRRFPDPAFPVVLRWGLP
jgi:hypothetical protein